MINSMTAFARQEGKKAFGTIIWELRSINHRYLEIATRLPEGFTELEAGIRERVRKKLTRGKVDCILRYQISNAENVSLAVNTALVKELMRASQSIRVLIENSESLKSNEILRWPGVITMAETPLSSIQNDVLTLFDLALDDLVHARKREGQQLVLAIQQRRAGMEKEIEKVKHRLPDILKTQREKLLSRLSEAKLELEPTRLEQEMLLFAQKIDISEELDRLNTHIIEMQRILQQGGAVGRHLDFLLQELNREANTIASKSADSETTNAAVELKVLIEQIREQVQNLE